MPRPSTLVAVCLDPAPHTPHDYMARVNATTYRRARCPGVVMSEPQVTQSSNTEGREYTMADLFATIEEVEAQDFIAELGPVHSADCDCWPCNPQRG